MGNLFTECMKGRNNKNERLNEIKNEKKDKDVDLLQIQHCLDKSDKNKIPIILLMTGSFNPIHKMHLKYIILQLIILYQIIKILKYYVDLYHHLMMDMLNLNILL